MQQEGDVILSTAKDLRLLSRFYNEKGPSQQQILRFTQDDGSYLTLIFRGLKIMSADHPHAASRKR